jgi:hypothetical protein
VRVQWFCGALMRAVPPRRRCAVTVCMAAVAVLGMVSIGAPAQASASLSAAQAPAKAHKAPVPSVVHPAKPPQGAAGATSVGKAPAVVVGNQPTAPVATPVYSPSMRAQMSAQAQARQSGKPVVVASLTTPTQQVVAQPNGLYELQSTVYPVRVQRNGAWIPVSTRLVPAGGGWAPAAVSTPVVFSGGGAGPLVTVTDAASGGTVSVWWPSPLPKPVVSGSAALYRGVLPGVDLRLEATDAGYSDVLVVHDAAAAANPALRSMSERVQVSAGLLAAQGAGGSLVVTNRLAGQVVATFGQALMWDSSDTHPQIPISPSADSAGSGRITEVPVAYQLNSGAGVVTVTTHPPAAALAGPAVRYPLFIDPSTGDVVTSYYAEVMTDSVQNQAWTTGSGTTSIGNNNLEVGLCDFSNCGRTDGASSYTMRDYFRFDTSKLEHPAGTPGATVYDVDFNVQQLYLADHTCTAQPAQLWSTSAGISSSTTWPGPVGSLLATGSSNAGGTAASGKCGPGYLDIDSAASGNSGLLSNLQDGANHATSTVNFLLRTDESHAGDVQYRWISDNPTLDVYYNYPPNTPTPTRVDNETTCTKDSSGNPIYYTSDNTPNVYAEATDNNIPELNLDWNFTVVDSSGTSHQSGWLNNTGNAGYAPGPAPGVERWWTSTALPNGPSSFTAQVRNVPVDGKAAQLSSGTSSRFSFTIQSATPATPAISSFDYPTGQWGQAAGEPGAFTVSSNNDTSVAGFSYAFDGTPGTVLQGAGSPACDYTNQGGLGTSITMTGDNKGYEGNKSGVLAAGPAGTAQILVPPVGTNGITTGRNTLTVEAFNSAHVASATYTYVFYVPSNYQSQPQYTDASTFVDNNQVSSSYPSDVIKQTNCCNLNWPSGGQLQFLATAAGQSFTIPLTVPAPPGSGSTAIPWQLGVYMTESYNYGQVKVDLDSGKPSAANLGGTATVPFDAYSPTVKGGYLDLGTPMLIPGSTHTLTFTVTGTSDTGHEVGVVYTAIGATNRYQADSLAGLPTSGPAQQQCLNEAAWSDNCQLMFTNATSGASFSVNFYVPMDRADYALGANLVTGADYGTEQFVIDPGSACIPLYGSVESNGGCQGSQSVSFNAYNSSVAAQYLFLGSANLAQGWHTLQVTVNGNVAASTSYNAGINFLDVVPVTGQTVQDFTSAMNNQGIAYDGAAITTMTSSFDLLNTATGGNLSEQSLASVGLITTATAAGKAWTGNSFSLNGAQFIMPTPRVDGSSNVIADNVIPDGQTIHFQPSQQVNATGVALLATSTCQASPEATMAINYTNSSSSNPTIPPVPDWFSATKGPTVIALGSYDLGTTSSTGHHPELYEVMLPAKPSFALSSITLPVMGANFLPDTGGCGGSPNILHILAIGVVPASDAAVPAADNGGVWTGAYDAPMDISVCCQTTANETFREEIPLSSAPSGSYLRIRLSNAYTTGPVTFDSVTVAAQSSTGGSGSTVATPQKLTFSGPGAVTACGAASVPCNSVTLAAGSDEYSDPISTSLLQLASGTGLLTVSMHILSTGPAVPGVSIHDQFQGLSTSYASGDQTGNSDTAGTTFTSANSMSGLLYVAGVDVSNTVTSTAVGTSTQYTGTVAVLGDQGAIAAPSGSAGNWPSYLQGALGSATVAGVSKPVNVAGSVVNASTGDFIPDDWWRMNGAPDSAGNAFESSTTAYDSGAAAVNNLTLEGGPTWSTSTPGTGTTSGSLDLSGSAQYGISPATVAVPSGSFAVSAWVNPASVPASGDAVAVARDGSSASEYYLGTHNGTWGFWFTGSDTASPTVTGAYGGAAATGTWTMLTGVYNASTGQVQLYVNGAQAASTTFTPAWTASGALTVGSGMVGGGQSDYLAGHVSDVRYYNRVMWPFNVSQVYNDTGMSSISAAGLASAMTSDQANYGSSGWLDYQAYAAGEPNLRDVIISLGANDILQDASATTIENNLQASVASLQARFLTQSPSIPVNVFVTTIPPLGLPASDQRETTRQMVNSWITGGNFTGTVPAFDITAAYPSGGLSTPADYEAVASLVANDIAAWMAGGPHSSSHPIW